MVQVVPRLGPMRSSSDACLWPAVRGPGAALAASHVFEERSDFCIIVERQGFRMEMDRPGTRQTSDHQAQAGAPQVPETDQLRLGFDRHAAPPSISLRSRACREMSSRWTNCEQVRGSGVAPIDPGRCKTKTWPRRGRCGATGKGNGGRVLGERTAPHDVIAHSS